MQVELGRTVQDRITGFTGVVTGIVYYLSGCHQALVVPRVRADGGLLDSQWFDLQRLRVKTNAKIVLDNGATPGFDAPAPKR